MIREVAKIPGITRGIGTDRELFERDIREAWDSGFHRFEIIGTWGSISGGYNAGTTARRAASDVVYAKVIPVFSRVSRETGYDVDWSDEYTNKFIRIFSYKDGERVRVYGEIPHISKEEIESCVRKIIRDATNGKAVR